MDHGDGDALHVVKFPRVPPDPPSPSWGPEVHAAVGWQKRSRCILPPVSPTSRPRCRGTSRCDSFLPPQREPAYSATPQREGGAGEGFHWGKWGETVAPQASVVSVQGLYIAGTNWPRAAGEMRWLPPRKCSGCSHRSRAAPGASGHASLVLSLMRDALYEPLRERGVGGFFFAAQPGNAQHGVSGWPRRGAASIAADATGRVPTRCFSRDTGTGRGSFALPSEN